MSNTADIIIKEQTITVTPQNVQGLVKYKEGGYAVIFEDGTSLSISKADYDAIKALDYSQGGGGAGGGIQSSTINNMEFDGDKTLTINGTPFEGGGDVPADLVEKVDDHQSVLYGNGGGEGGYNYTSIDPMGDWDKTYEITSHVMEVGAVCQDEDWLRMFDGPDVKRNFVFCDLSQIPDGQSFYGINLKDTNTEWTEDVYIVVKENGEPFNYDTIRYTAPDGTQRTYRLDWQAQYLMTIYNIYNHVFQSNDESAINVPSGGKGLIARVDELESKPSSPLEYDGESIKANDGSIVCGHLQYTDEDRHIESVKSGEGEIKVYEDFYENTTALKFNNRDVIKLNNGDNQIEVFGNPIAGGGSSMVYDPSTGILSGAKTTDGAPYDFEVGTITITI